MPRGEYVINDELVIPNQFTREGLTDVMLSMFTSLDAVWQWGFCSKGFEQNQFPADIGEPTIGVGGYARKTLNVGSLGAADWGASIVFDGVAMISTGNTSWTPTGAGWDKPVNRMFLYNAAKNHIVSFSAAIPAPVFKTAFFITAYRLYFE